MLKKIYIALLKFKISRCAIRKFRSKILSLFGYSDPFFDLARLSALSKATLYLDVGSHHGKTISRARESGVICPIFGFDPIIENVAVATSFCRELDNITIANLALSDSTGIALFFKNSNEQTSSLLENDIGNRNSFPDDTSHVSELMVQTITLDEWLRGQGCENERIIIKCDAQGAEGKILDGARASLKSQIVAIYAEVMLAPMYEGQQSFDTINKKLQDDFDFILHKIYPCMLDAKGRVVQTDALWVKSEYLALLQ